MKINAALAKTLLLVASTGMVIPMLAKPPVAPTPAPAKQDATAKAKTDAEEPEPTIPGFSTARANGGFIGITIEGGCLKVAFYDSKKKQVDCDVARGLAHWHPKNTIAEERKALNPSGDGKTLVSPVVQPPYNLKLFLTLLSEDGQVLESFSGIDFHG